MRLQFSIAGVMSFTVVVALGLWSMLYADFLLAHITTISLLVGSVVGWFVGASYGQARRGSIAGVLGALLWVCAVVLCDLNFWNPALRFQVWSSLTAAAALGAVPMSSTVSVYNRAPIELIVQPMISCIVAVLIAGLAASIGFVVTVLLYNPSHQWGNYLHKIIVPFSILLPIGTILAALIGAGYGTAALVLRSLEAEGRKYRDAHLARSNQPGTATGKDQDSAPVDHQ